MMIQFLLLLILAGCTANDTETQSRTYTEQIRGRGAEGKRPLLYRVKIPKNWVKREPLPEADLSDTTLSIVDFFIVEEDGTIRIALHNFPSRSIEQRIPPAAQVARWQKQITDIDPAAIVIQPISFSGYKGLHFEGAGRKEDSSTMVLGWSLQLADVHYRALTPSSDQPDTNETRERRADVTIKATGPKKLVERHKEEISAFAQSFELIEEIPSH